MRKIVIILLVSFTSQVFGKKISDAYKALSILDYFKAKHLFYKSLSKFTAESSYGLATIYFKTDNPFSNIDSAAKYIAIAKNNFKDTVTYSSYHINYETIHELAIQIGNKGFEKYSQQNITENYNHFLSHFYFSDSSLIQQCYLKRDILELNKALSIQSSDSVAHFLLRYPQSELYPKAKKLFYDFQFLENTLDKSINQYQIFIKKHPNNPNVIYAENNLLDLIQPLHSSDSIYNFIKNYSTVLTKENAWKLLYSTSVKSYNKEELTKFLIKYPDYPFNESILKEISLTENILIPLKNLRDKFGFIDTLGNWVILAQYDDALDFKEGFASVCKNDSCFYINKEGKKIFDHHFEEAENFKEGVAIVKKGKMYFLINRAGQYISKGYQDINDPSEKLYVCKSNNLYGAINGKGEIVIPFSYSKLGNFKNKYAYYLSNQYGLVDINNNALQAKWDWISDIDSNSSVVVKQKNKFGLMTINEQIILSPKYDYISNSENDIYLVVKNNVYGFYNSKEKCFITAVDYDYNPAYATSYYTNGKYFKLIKNDEVALIDANGRYSINFGNYSNLFFAKCDVIRIHKNNKYGYVDRKLKAITPIEFEEATDFRNDLAIVVKKGISQLINTKGKAIYTLKDGIITGEENSNYYTTSFNDQIGLINYKGEVLLDTQYISIETIAPNLFYCKKNDGIFLYSANTKIIKKL